MNLRIERVTTWQTRLQKYILETILEGYKISSRRSFILLLRVRLKSFLFYYLYIIILMVTLTIVMINGHHKSIHILK